jgi:SCY1-like protein 2
MTVIRKLGDRVEKEHHQFLRDSQRIEDRSSAASNGSSVINGNTAERGPLDFESLVGGSGGAVKADTNATPNWDDDPWGSILGSNADVRICIIPIGVNLSLTWFLRRRGCRVLLCKLLRA